MGKPKPKKLTSFAVAALAAKAAVAVTVATCFTMAEGSSTAITPTIAPVLLHALDATCTQCIIHMDTIRSLRTKDIESQNATISSFAKQKASISECNLLICDLQHQLELSDLQVQLEKKKLAKLKSTSPVVPPPTRNRQREGGDSKMSASRLKADIEDFLSAKFSNSAVEDQALHAYFSEHSDKLQVTPPPSLCDIPPTPHPPPPPTHTCNVQPTGSGKLHPAH